jgi:hypothetical protein
MSDLGQQAYKVDQVILFLFKLEILCIICLCHFDLALLGLRCCRLSPEPICRK